MQGNSTTNESVIPRNVIAAVATPYSLPHAVPTFTHETDLITPTTYGAGQMMYSYRGHYIIEHGGAVPGQMSQVMRVPGAGIGVAVMVNDNEFGTGFYQVVNRRILDHLFGLEPIDWAAKWVHCGQFRSGRLTLLHRVKTGIIEKLQSSLPPSRPANATIDIDLDTIPGTYSDVAYGQLTICALDDKTDVCSKTLSGNPFPMNTDIPSFVAYFPKFWSDYLLFSHRNGSTFTVETSATYAETNVTLASPFESYDAVFNGQGMAWTRNAWGAGPGVEGRSLASGSKEGAEVWFEKQ
jgi:hypothetical protein